MRSNVHKPIAVLLAFVFLAPAILRGQQNIVLVETGSGMPEPLYKYWNQEYHKQVPSTDIRYIAVGTGESARNVLAGSGDFGGVTPQSPNPSFALPAKPCSSCLPS